LLPSLLSRKLPRKRLAIGFRLNADFKWFSNQIPDLGWIVISIFWILCQADYKKIGLVPQKFKAAIEHEWWIIPFSTHKRLAYHSTQSLSD
jgi:hypothetical protein